MSKPPLGLLQRLRALVLRGEFDKVKDQLEGVQAYDAAWTLARFPFEERLQMLAGLAPDKGAKIFEEFPLPIQTELLRLGMGIPQLIAIFQYVDSDEAADVLGTLESTEKDRWLAVLPSQEKTEAQSLLQYPADTAGGMMAKEYVSVPVHLTAAEVARRLQTLAPSFEHLKVTYVYVVDEHGVLKGVLPMRDLVLKPGATPVSTLLIETLATMPVTASKREVAELFRERNLLALPVITSDGRLAGVITADDVMDVIREIADEELLKISGVSLEESRDVPVSTSLRRRFSWLSFNILLNLMAASVIPFFEATLTQVIALAFFMPIISDMSGNAGTQAVAISIRDLAMQRIIPRDYFRIIRYELFLGFFNGLALGIIVGLVAYLLKGIPMLGVVVTVALWLNMMIAVVVGGVLPLFLKRFGFDPATGSGPILTTVTDMLGFFLLLSLATYWMPYLKPS